MIKPDKMVKQLNQLSFSLLLAGYKVCPPNWYKKERRRHFHSLWFIAKGTGEIQINGKPYKAEPGKVFFLEPGMVCSISSDKNNTLEYYFIRFSYAMAYEYGGEWIFHTSEETPFPMQGAFLLHNSPRIVTLFEQVMHLWKRRGEFIEIRRKFLFQELLLLIVQDIRKQKITGDTTLAIELTIEHMVYNYKSNIKLDTLANMAGLSVSHYSRLFKKYVGYSPIDYLTHIRIDRAKELLVLSEYRIKDISKSVGYKDELYFSRTFKKIVGVSPTAYMQKNRTPLTQRK